MVSKSMINKSQLWNCEIVNVTLHTNVAFYRKGYKSMESGNYKLYGFVLVTNNVHVGNEQQKYNC